MLGPGLGHRWRGCKSRQSGRQGTGWGQAPGAEAGGDDTAGCAQGLISVGPQGGQGWQKAGSRGHRRPSGWRTALGSASRWRGVDLAGTAKLLAWPCLSPLPVGLREVTGPPFALHVTRLLLQGEPRSRDHRSLSLVSACQALSLHSPHLSHHRSHRVTLACDPHLFLAKAKSFIFLSYLFLIFFKDLFI